MTNNISTKPDPMALRRWSRQHPRGDHCVQREQSTAARTACNMMSSHSLSTQQIRYTTETMGARDIVCHTDETLPVSSGRLARKASIPHDSELNVCTENAFQRLLPTADLFYLHSASRIALGSLPTVFGGWCHGYVIVAGFANVVERTDSERVRFDGETHAVRSTFSPATRTSCPTVMDNNVPIAESIRFRAGCGRTAHPSQTCVLVRISLSR